MKTYFYELSDRLIGNLHGDETLLLTYDGENSEFARLNHNKIRQAGNVNQHFIRMRLIRDDRQMSYRTTLNLDADGDFHLCRRAIERMRADLEFLPQDPYLLFATDVVNTENETKQDLDAREMLSHILSRSQDLDLAGIFAAGTMAEGFANSLGQKNWHEVDSFHFDWSCYSHGDKAIKHQYAGLRWDDATFDTAMSQVRDDLERLHIPAVSIEPGRYRCYLAPSALREIMDMMSWGGFGIKSHRGKQSALLQLSQGQSGLNSAFNLSEDTAGGLAAVFTGDGFIKPERVALIEQGRWRDYLVSPRSAREYHTTVNAGGEYPQSLHLLGGKLPQTDIAAELDTGLWINQLWYCNFTDRNRCRINGMTRFGCFWLENGSFKAPVNVMRFDDSLYDLFGENLLALTDEKAYLFDDGTYHGRSTTSYRLPGALVKDFNFSF